MLIFLRKVLKFFNWRIRPGWRRSQPDNRRQGRRDEIDQRIVYLIQEQRVVHVSPEHFDEVTENENA